MANYVLLLLSISATYTSSKTISSHDASTIINISTTDRANRVITLPLLTYRALKRRRMLEMNLSEKSMDSYLESLPSTPHDRSSYNQRRRTSSEVGGLYQGYGTHYVDIWIGTPAQRQTVIVDTGSGVTAFPCSACKDCGEDYHASPFFIEDDSNTFKKMTCDSCAHTSRSYCQNRNKKNEFCRIGVSYQEGSSWTAYEAEDQSYLGGPHNYALKREEDVLSGGKHLGATVVDEDPADAAEFSFPLKFGCQTKITGLFKTQLADGIMGMCIQEGSFWKQMYDAEIITSQKFSLCFSRESSSDSDGTLAGAVTMGGTDPNLHLTPMVYASGAVAGGIMHGLTMRKIYFMKAGQYSVTEATKETVKIIDVSPAVLNKGRVILDSGTTDTYFNRDIASSFRKVFKEMVGVDYDPDHGMKLTEKQIEMIPSLVVQLKGRNALQVDGTPGLAAQLDDQNPDDILVVVPPTNYFDYNSAEEKYYPRIFINENSETVLGANFMAGHDILFDISENSRIGFAVSDCDYSALINDTLTSHRGDAFGRIAPAVPDETDDSGASLGACESILCRYRLLIFLGCLFVVMSIHRMHWRYKRNLEEFRMAQTEILNDLYLDEELEEEIDDGIAKEIQMRELT